MHIEFQPACPWYSDWEGDTLVVDTTNSTDKTRFRESTENLHVIERFTRTSDRTLLYRFTVEDPNTWERPWTARNDLAGDGFAHLRIRLP